MDAARKPGEHLQRAIQLGIEHGYRQFINLVARGRDMDPDAVEEVAQGRVWIGSQAHELGLVDGLGSLADAVAAAAELADLTDYGIKRFTTPLSPRDVLIQQFMDSAELAPPVRIPGAIAQGTGSCGIAERSERHLCDLRALPEPDALRFRQR